MPATWRTSVFHQRLLTLGVLGLMAAVLAGRPAFAVMAAAPLSVAFIAARSSAGHVAVTMTLPGTRYFEGDEFEVLGQVAADTVVLIDARLEAARGLSIVGGPETLSASSDSCQLRWTVRVDSWGYAPIGPVVARVHDADLLKTAEFLSGTERITAFPTTEQIARPALPRTLPNRLGNHTSRAVGDGLEFAGIRPSVVGDSHRRLNWRASARYQKPFVTQLHVERSAELVVVVDSYSDVGPQGRTSLDVSVRGAASLAQSYLSSNDRVGLVALGGVLRWVSAESGSRQYYRVLEALLDARDTVTVVRPELERLPRAVLPTGSLVVLFSPLLDDRAVEVARDLRERRFPVVVVDVLTADPHVHTKTAASAAALQMWRLQRQVMRGQLSDIGVHLVDWDGVGPLDAALAMLPTGGRIA